MDILFWSGGKDAFLAHEFYRRRHPNSTLKLLTSYNKESGIVPHQQISLEHIKAQAKALKLDLILVPLPDKCPNEIYLQQINNVLSNQEHEVEQLVFGDWYLKDIRNWREEQFKPRGYNCLFPIWKKELHELLPVLLLKSIDIKISAVAKEYRSLIKVGEKFNQHFIRQLPSEIDPMGEKGEFHTEVVFKSWD